MLKLRKLLLLSKTFYIILFLTIILTIIRFNIKPKSILNVNTKVVSGVITKLNYDNDKISITLKISSSENLKVTYYLKNNKFVKLKLGESVKLIGNIKEISSSRVLNGFNYKEYLKIEKVNYLFSARKIIKLNKKIPIIYLIKNKVLDYINSFHNSSYIKMLLLGDDSGVDNKVINSFRENGISHLFAISGTQVTVLAEVIMKLLLLIKIKEKKRYIITNSFIIIYMLLTGSPPAILRAVIFFFLSSINKYNYFYITNMNLFILTLSITLIINPYYIYDLGFLYSYLISFGLILFSKYFENKNFFLTLLYTSIISFIISVPITLYHFYQLNFSSIIYNLFYVPFVNTILFPIAYISLLFYPLDYLLTILIKVLETSSLYISKISYGKIIFPKLSIVYYLLYFVVIYLIYKNNKKLTVIFLTTFFIFNYSYKSIFNSDYVYFFDVGQGDSTLLHLDSKNILIDTGGKENTNIVNNTQVPYFKSDGIRKIDYLIITHGDFDHMGEAINLINNFKVEKVIFNCGPYNELETELIKVLDKKKIKHYSCIKELNIDKNKLYFLQTKEYDNENDNSNVIYTELDGYKFMFMGDASTTTEKEILSKYNLPDIDVLKVGHHGSRTSSGKDFINEINPKYSIISVGKNNRYGHPNKEVLDNLNNSKIYRTDENGSIMFKIKNNKLQIKTCSP